MDSFLFKDSDYKEAIRMYYSQYGEEEILNSFFDKTRDGFVVEVGAADGLLNSNSRYLIESLGWRGILVEPHPTYFNLLEQLYSDNNKVKLINSAAHSIKGEMSFFLYGHDHRAQVSTLSEDFKKRVCDVHGDKYLEEAITVSVLTLEDILPSEDINFLSIDCEGVDMEVLKSNNWETKRPQLICVEHSMPKVELDSYMKEINYELLSRTQGNSFYHRSKK